MTKPLPKNPDRVTPPVAQLGTAGVLLAGLARVLIDRYVDPADREFWWNLFQTVVVPGIPLVLAFVGALQARRNVTPILKGDHPRNNHGELLVPEARHDTARGYPPPDPETFRDEPTRAQMQQKYPRVDKRGIDRERPDL